LKQFRILIFALLLASAAVAAAKPPFWRAFVALYNIKPDSVIGKTRCLNCHQPPGPPKRNAYGNAVEAALRAANARMVTPEMLKSIEHKDAGDKVAFIAKIKADIPPAQLKATGKKSVKKAATKPPKTAHFSGSAGALLLVCLGATMAALGTRLNKQGLTAANR
jgi:hypothetical protein